MSQNQDINDIIVERPLDLMLDYLWTDPAIIAKIKANLNLISPYNIKHYHKQFVGDKP